MPTLVEVKRSSDTRIRREVVGQMLDYAANGLVYWPPDEIRRVFEQGCQERQLDPEQEVEGLTGAEESYEGFWERVKTNLKAGRIRLLFVADRIPAELLRIVEFLNEQMTLAEVLAVEIRQFAGADAITLVPRVLGRTAAAEQTKGKGPREKRQWDEASFFAALQRNCSPAEVTVARDVLDWARGVTQEISWGQGVRQGSFVPTVEHAGSRHHLFAAWTGGTIELYFYWYAFREPFSDRDKRLEMRQMLQEIPGIEFAESAVDRRPSFPMAALVDPSALDRFRAVFEWFIAEVKASESSQTAEQVD